MKLNSGKTVKAFAIKSLLASVLLGVLCIMLLELWNGPHPECGFNDSVGPCGYGARVIYDLPAIMVLSPIFWAVIVYAKKLPERAKLRQEKQKNTIN